MIDFSVIIYIVMGVAQLSKKTRFNPRFIPLLNVAVAITLSLIWMEGLDYIIRIQQGLLIGLSASGVYDVCMSMKRTF